MSVPHADSSLLPADREADRYHSVSGLAVVAFVLGILSPLALVGPILWLVPLLGIVIAALAMWKISFSGGELVGWNVALFGLLFALLFGVAAPARTLTRQYWIECRAELFAKQFISLLQQGHAYGAFQLTLPPPFRKPLDIDLSAEYAKNPKAQQKYDAFLQLTIVKKLLADHQQSTVQWLDTGWLIGDADNNEVMATYRISQPGKAPTESFVAQLVMVRSLDPINGHEQWRIRSADVEE